MFKKYILGNEKAIIGSLAAGIVSLLGQVGVNGQMTVKEAIYSVLTLVATHAAVWTSTNSSVQPESAPIVAPEVDPNSGI